MWFIGVEEQETSAPPPKKNPGSAPELESFTLWSCKTTAKKCTKKCAALAKLFFVVN